MKESCVSLPNFGGNSVVWLNGAYREFYQQYTVPARARARAKKRTRTSAHIKWLFSTKQVVSPFLTSATGAAFLVCARKQHGSAFARLRSHRQRLRPVIHTLCSRGDNQETVQPRNSARYRRKEPERRPASFPRAQRKDTCVGVGKSRDR